MPKGFRETFRLELKPDFKQRKTWDALEKDGKLLCGLAFARLEKAAVHGWTIHRGTFVDHVLRDAMSEVSILKEETVRGILRQAHDRFTRQIAATGSVSTRRKADFVYEVPRDEIVFSSSEPMASVPYLGMVRYLPNNKISMIAGVKGAEASDNKAWLWANLRRVGLEVWNCRHVLLLDCTDEEEEERRRQAEVDKAVEKVQKRRAKTASDWLGDVPDRRAKA